MALAATLVSTARAAGGPLTGKSLQTTRETRSTFESLAGSLLVGDLRGDVLQVTVTEDSPRRLVVSVRYRGFENGRLWGEVLQSPRTPQAGVLASEPVALSGGEGEVELTFEAEKGAFASGPVRSPYLRLNAALAQRTTPSFRRSFELGKDWSAASLAGSDFVTTVTPRPIGRTAELGPRPTLVVPTSQVVAPAPPASAPATTGPTAILSRRADLGGTFSKPMVRTIGGSGGATSAPPAAPAPNPNAAASKLPASESIRWLTVANFGLTPAQVDRGARGPSAIPVLPFGVVRTEDIALDLPRVLDFSPEVFPDANPESGVFYFVPAGYALHWDADQGYAFRTVYSSAATPGGAGEVLMAARLESGIVANELQVASDLVRAYAAAHGLRFSELRALPVQSVSASLANVLGQYSIRPDRVAVQGVSDLMSQMDVSWVTDERTTLFIREALTENVGLAGDVTLTPVGEGVGPRNVPLRLRLADDATFGPFRWDRTGWRNTTPYPITLRYLHALRVEPGQTPVVHSWSLGDTRVPPGGQVRWNATGVPFWLDASARKMWLDYGVEGQCRECGAAALAALTGGVSSTGGNEITFHTVTPLAESGALAVVAEVRSRWWDPQGRELRTRQVVLDADGRDFRLGPLFAPASADGGALFEYRLALTMKNGKPETGLERWIPSRDLYVPIGSFQLETSLGALPPK